MGRRLLVGLLLLGTCTATAAPVDETPLSEASDAVIEARAAQWESLSVDERRALLTEIHKRMVAAGKKPVLRIQAERRYGYRIQRPDGSIVEIRKREGFVRYHALDPDRPFGVGFERRQRPDAGRSPLSAVKAPLPGIAVPAAEGAPVFQLPLDGARYLPATGPASERVGPTKAAGRGGDGR